MTKTEIVTLITRRLGDPSATYFGDRAWDYFEQELYRILASGQGFSGDEIADLRAVAYLPVRIESNGTGDIDLSLISNLYQIERVMFLNRLVESVTADEYYKLISHEFFQPYGNEAKYFRVGNVMKFATGYSANDETVTIYYFKTLDDIADDDTVNLGKHIIYDAVDKAVFGLKQEIGMVTQ